MESICAATVPWVNCPFRFQTAPDGGLALCGDATHTVCSGYSGNAGFPRAAANTDQLTEFKDGNVAESCADWRLVTSMVVCAGRLSKAATGPRFTTRSELPPAVRKAARRSGLR